MTREPSSEPEGPGPLPSLREAMSELRIVRAALGLETHLVDLGSRLDVATEELRVAEEELEQRLAELDSADQGEPGQPGGPMDHLLTRRLIDALPIAVVSTDEHGAVQDLNEAAALLLELPRKLARGKPIFAYVAMEDRPAARSLISRPAGAGQVADVSISLRLRSGTSVRCRVGLGRGGPTGEGPFAWVLDEADSDARDADSRGAIVELCSLGVTGMDLRSLLTRVAVLTRVGVIAADAASLVLGDPSAPELMTSSDRSAQEADGKQYQGGQGPIFDAYLAGATTVVADLQDDGRWPRIARGRTGADGGMRSCLALPLLAESGAAFGVLCLYAAEPGRLVDAVAQQQARPFVIAAQTLVRDSRLVTELGAVRDQLGAALASRAVIDQAKGMIMLKHGCSAEQAFAFMTRLSNDTNRKVRELAVEIVAEGAALPGVSPPR